LKEYIEKNEREIDRREREKAAGKGDEEAGNGKRETVQDMIRNVEAKYKLVRLTAEVNRPDSYTVIPEMKETKEA